MKFERIVNFSQPFDKRSNDPNKNYGIGSLRIRFILKGKKGAVQILLGANMYLSATINEYNKKGINLFTNYKGDDKPVYDCWDVGYHSKKPMYEGQEKMDCDIFKNGCYYDGSSLRGRDDKVAEMFLEKGEDAIWEYLEKYYYGIFPKSKPKEKSK